MAVNILKRITTRAKQLRKAHPKMTWAAAVSKASKEIKKTSGVKKQKKTIRQANNLSRAKAGKVKQTGTRKSLKSDRGRKASLPGARISKTGRYYVETRANRTDRKGALSGITADQVNDVQRSVLKRQIRLKGLTVASNVSDAELQKYFKKIVGRKVPTKAKIKILLKKRKASEVITYLIK